MLRYSGHARRRMAARRISEAEVEETLATRHVAVHETAGLRRPGAVVVVRTTLRSGRRLKVGAIITSADDDFRRLAAQLTRPVVIAHL